MTIKLQNGGGMPPFTYFQPVTVTQPRGTAVAQQATAASNTKSDEISNKDILKALDKIDGLPSDMEVLKTGLISSLGSNSLFGNNSLFGSVSDLSTAYANTLVSLKVANFSKKKYDDVKSNLDKNGGLNEIAVTESGGVIVSDNEGKLSQVSIDTYLNNRNKYKALTNSNLLYMRAYDTEYANNDQLMQIAANGIGLPQINKYIKEYLGKLGNSEQTKESYNVLQGVENLQKVYEQTGEIKLEGLYKNKIISSSQVKQAQQALTYIWQMLPENAKAVLKLKTGSLQGAYELIGNLVTSGTSDKYEFHETYLLDKDGNKPGAQKKGSDGKDGREYKPGVVSNFIRGNGKEETFTIMNGTSDGIQVTGISIPLTNNSGKVLGQASLQTINKGGFSGVLDWSNISMGGVHISQAHMGELLCIDGNIHSIDFPIDLEAYNKDGSIIPNYKMFEAKKAADDYIKQNKIIDFNKINEVYKSKGLPIKYDSEGNLNTTYWARFGVMNGVALSKAFDEDQSFSDLLQEVDDRELDSYLHIFNQEANITANNEAKGKGIEFDKSSLWDKLWGNGQHWWSTHDQMFKGTIFIPIKNDEFAAMAGDDSHAKIGENESIAGLVKDQEVIDSFNEEGLLE